MVMYFGNSSRTSRLSLRSSHDRVRVRIGVSHREVPSSWNAPSKDVDPPPSRGKSKRKGNR